MIVKMDETKKKSREAINFRLLVGDGKFEYLIFWEALYRGKRKLEGKIFEFWFETFTIKLTLIETQSKTKNKN